MVADTVSNTAILGQNVTSECDFIFYKIVQFYLRKRNVETPKITTLLSVQTEPSYSSDELAQRFAAASEYIYLFQS